MLKHSLSEVSLTQHDKLSTLVENRQSFDMSNCQLNVFETHQYAENVNLCFDDLVLTSMLRGKKIMHLPGKEAFDYFPGESVIVQPGETMVIDFPIANENEPTQCIALAISKEQINRTLELVHDKFPKQDATNPWHIDINYFHLMNNLELSDIINRMINIGLYDHSNTKDIIADLTLRELLIRLMQTQARTIIDMNYFQMSNQNRFAHVVKYIKDNITEKLDIDTLCSKACMSRPNFFRKFKQTFGISPAEFVLEEKIKFARKILSNGNYSVSEVCYMTGFQNLNHFIRAFKTSQGTTPKKYQMDLRN